MAALIEQETPGAEGGALPFDIGKWLDDNKLGEYKQEFIKEQVDIEELLSLTSKELQDVAQDLGITKTLHKNRFVKAVQKLVQDSQTFNKDKKQNNNDAVSDNLKKEITITKEEAEVLDKIKLKMKEMKDLNNSNDYIVENINIMSKKCENDINYIFDILVNGMKNRQKELIEKTKMITNKKLSLVNQQKIGINEYLNELKQFEVSWNKAILNQNDANNGNNEPGHNLNERKQQIISKSNELLNKDAKLNIDLKNAININFVLSDKERENIHQFVSKIGYIEANNPPNPPIISITDINDISDVTAQITMDFSNNTRNKALLATKYSIQIAESKGNNNKEDEEKKGEVDIDENDEFKIDWKDIATNDINQNKIKFVVKDLKCNARYLLQCKCCNKYGWSAFCKYITFKTKERIFKIDSCILNENEKQILCQSILIDKLGKNKDGLNVHLLFRGSRDGFGADKFHKKCDGKRRTIIIVESNLGNVFGAYTKIPWSGDNQWHTDSTSFLFLCRDLNRNNKNNNNGNNGFEIYPIKQSHHNKAVKHYAAHGPCFGKGHDLLLVNAANMTDSRSDGESFVNLQGNKLTGSNTQIYNKYWHFVCRDYEVFQIL